MSDSESCSEKEENNVENVDEKAYFNTKPKTNLQFNEEKSELFGKVQKIVKSNVLIKPLDKFDIIYSGVLKVNNAYGEIFDMIGPQYEPLYIARFQNTELSEGDDVFIDNGSIILYDAYV